MVMQCPYVVRQYVSDRAFDTHEVNLTTANTNLQVTVGDFSWVQAFCDGQPFGITIGIGTQDNKFAVDQFWGAPVVAATKVYVTNDVRSGRSKLLLVFSRTAPLERYLGGQISLAEHAARLGSIHTFDRRGEIIFADDFESGLGKWTQSVVSTGTGGSVSLSPTWSRSKSLSCKLTTGDGDGDITSIARMMTIPNLSRFGEEITIYFPSTTNVKDIILRIRYYSGAILHNAGIQLSLGGEVKYVDSAGNWSSISSGVNANLISSCDLSIKYVADFTDGNYIRLNWQGIEYNLSGYRYQQLASAIGKCLYISFALTNSAAANVLCYLDDSIVTQNEP